MAKASTKTNINCNCGPPRFLPSSTNKLHSPNRLRKMDMFHVKQRVARMSIFHKMSMFCTHIPGLVIYFLCTTFPIMPILLHICSRLYMHPLLTKAPTKHNSKVSTISIVHHHSEGIGSCQCDRTICHPGGEGRAVGETMVGNGPVIKLEVDIIMYIILMSKEDCSIWSSRVPNQWSLERHICGMPEWL